jgi:hypothetical protein
VFDWEWETIVVVRREGNFTRSGPEIVDETNLFPGNQNSLFMSQTYTHEFQCQYDFGWYPFDTQVKLHPQLYIFVLFLVLSLNYLKGM